MAICSDNTSVLVGVSSGRIRKWHIRDDSLSRDIVRHHTWISAIAAHPYKPIAASVDMGHLCVIWDLERLQPLREFNIAFAAAHMAFDLSDTLPVLYAARSSVYAFNYETGVRIGEVNSHAGTCLGLACMPSALSRKVFISLAHVYFVLDRTHFVPPACADAAPGCRAGDNLSDRQRIARCLFGVMLRTPPLPLVGLCARVLAGMRVGEITRYVLYNHTGSFVHRCTRACVA